MFHPIVQNWFDNAYGAPTPCQQQAWPAFRQCRNVLVAAPTGSGKTLAAFLAAIDDLVRELVEQAQLDDETRILYVSPLKALSNDIEKNLREPLQVINSRLVELGIQTPITAAVRTGDTTSSERQRMIRRPPHILVTTPESLFILLTSQSGRKILGTVGSVIVDEIHALAPNKRGAHLCLSLERLSQLTTGEPIRIGLSATQNPLSRVASFLSGSGNGEDVVIVDRGLQRERDLEIMLPDSPLEAVMSAEVWGELYARLVEQIRQHRTTLVFVNTRRQAERVAKQLAAALGDEQVTSHHGSLSREHRLHAETRLKNGQLRALVATASLELGIDIGDVDLVCQLGSPRSVSVLLQRVGRSGHGVGRIPRGRLFPLSRDDLVECVALLKCCDEGLLDEICIPLHPLDVLAQQIVAETANQEWTVDELYGLVCRADPYRSLGRETFEEVLRMLTEGFSTRRGRRGSLLHVDLVNGRVRGKKGARLAALTNGGAIPDLFDYDVVMEPEGIRVGTLNEDFAFESLAGDIFQLGNASYRILRIEKGIVRVADARGQPPNIPFWFGEAPGRGDTLSRMLGKLREDVAGWMKQDPVSAVDEAVRLYRIDIAVASQLVGYLGAAFEAFGKMLPNCKRIIAERFFDEAGDMHLVIHSCFGSRMNRAFGLALRKRFCRRFNFELQAAALEDCIVLSLGETHSFDLDEVADYLHPETVRQILIQALLDAPVFPTHWRWVTNISLAVKRFRNGKKVPAQFQRSDAEDLVAVIFPDQLACFENIQGDREVPDHPLVNQALWDCLNDVMDIEALEQFLIKLRSGQIEWVSRDLVAPSPLAEEVLTARPYAFLDDAPAEERRTLAVQTRGAGRQDNLADYAVLDTDAVGRVRQEAWPDPTNADEMHDALVCGGFITEAEVAGAPPLWSDLLRQLVRERRVTLVHGANQTRVWVAAERLGQICEIIPSATCEPDIDAAGWRGDSSIDADTALLELIRSRLEILGPVTAPLLADSVGVGIGRIEATLTALATQGFAISGEFDTAESRKQWCDRRLLARIHRYTLKRLRSEIEAVDLSAFMRFLFQWQHLDSTARVEGVDGVAEVISQLEGYGISAPVWESEIIPARVFGYTPSLLDQLSLSGRLLWRRCIGRPQRADGSRSGTRGICAVPLAFYMRETMRYWQQDAAGEDSPALSASAGRLYELLQSLGASFYDVLQNDSRMLPAQLENALSELVSAGSVTCDGFNGFRALMLPESRRRSPGRVLQRRSRRLSSRRIEQAGRWSLVPDNFTDVEAGVPSRIDQDEAMEYICEVLLHRYGVVTRAIVNQEKGLPPWRLLLPVLRRLEARGDVRGGRFVAILSGEQFALPEAVEQLRKQRQRPASDNYIKIHAQDPLNFSGGVLPDQRISGNRMLLFKNGTLIATRHGREIQFVTELSEQQRWKVKEKLLVTNMRGRNYQRTLPLKVLC